MDRSAIFAIESSCNDKSSILYAIPNIKRFIGIPIIAPHVNILENSVPTKVYRG